MSTTSTPRFLHSIVLAGVLLPGCIDGQVTLQDEGGDTRANDGSTTMTSATTAGTTFDPPFPTSTTGPDPADDTVLPDPTTGSQFVPPNDAGHELYECNHFVQDCPAGEKCMIYSHDGSWDWNATRCVPLAPEPADIGEPCTVEGSGYSGLDDCDVGLICWDVDPETNEGQCEPFCVGSGQSEDELYCVDPGRHCMIGANGLVALCLPVCNPIVQDCAEGFGCYPYNDDWICAPDGSEAIGEYGDPCEFINVCAPGLACMGSQSAPPGLPCEGTAGCCLAICDVSLGDAQCPGVTEGEICQPWYEEGTAPVGYDDVGVCMVP